MCQYLKGDSIEKDTYSFDSESRQISENTINEKKNSFINHASVVTLSSECMS